MNYIKYPSLKLQLPPSLYPASTLGYLSPGIIFLPPSRHVSSLFIPFPSLHVVCPYHSFHFLIRFPASPPNLSTSISFPLLLTMVISIILYLNYLSHFSSSSTLSYSLSYSFSHHFTLAAHSFHLLMMFQEVDVGVLIQEKTDMAVVEGSDRWCNSCIMISLCCLGKAF